MGVLTFPAIDQAVAARWRASGHWPGRLLDDYLDEAVARTPHRPAVVDGATTLTYAELADRVGAATAGFRALGVTRGDVVSIQLPNWWEALVAHLAVIRLGAVSNPLMPILREREMRFALATARSRVLVVPGTFRGFDHAALGTRLRADLPDLEHVVVVRGSGETTFDDLDGPDRSAVENREPTDPAVLLYTSGTESDPKGAVHCHETLATEDASMIAHFGLTGDDVVWMPSPVAHVTGVLYGFHLATMLATTVVYQDVWDPGAALALIEARRCSVTVAATPFLHGIVHHPERDAHDVSSLRVFACGGADVPPGLVLDATAALDCLVVRVYGSTEIPTATAGHASDPAELRAGTDGRPIGAAELRVVDPDDGRDLPSGSPGLLLARGPEMFAGYLGRPRPFDEAGWFPTGDLGSVDDDGFLTVTGRSKDIILRGGENLSAKAIEDLLYAHPGVADVAVVAVPDPVLTERACAVVVPRPGAEVTLESLGAFLGEQGVARQKCPERLEVVAELPRTPTGKVQKFKLRADLVS
ncbi:AMP-binding protein [Actinomycetospora endophytica]|uniref:AMP-binding protein n=1 Tax=Actinomycetospora endophytica TaxID=2291215 RepID=A0ABS8PKP5_9PSEU|nr:AMP-binding protein [Actinomycetospora endophytica]MCD2197981.1 AMP-binding protein [Actinomycetospora endophytica]